MSSSPVQRRIGPLDTSHASRLFPTTRRDWLATQAAAGGDGRLEANEFVMSIYASPLAVYVRGSSFRGLGDAEELVDGFFASRLSRDDFFARWLESGKPFRRWLVNAFLFHLHETAREARGAAALDVHELDSPSHEPSAEASFERAWTREIVRRACAAARERCRDANKSDCWELFLSHHVRGQPYGDAARALGSDPARASAMARYAAMAFRRALLDLLVQDGARAEELDAELARLVTAAR